MTTPINNRQRIGRAVRDLAQPTGRFWLGNYRDYVVYKGTRLSGGGLVLASLDGDCGVVVHEDGPYRVEFRMKFPYESEQSPKKSLWMIEVAGEGREIARYNGKMQPVTVTGDLPESYLDALEGFAAGVKQKWRSR